MQILWLEVYTRSRSRWQDKIVLESEGRSKRGGGYDASPGFCLELLVVMEDLPSHQHCSVDTTTTLTMDPSTNYQNQIDTTMTGLQDYMNVNSLTMNRSKTKLLMSKKPQHQPQSDNQRH